LGIPTDKDKNRFSELYTGMKFCKLDVDGEKAGPVAQLLKVNAMPTIVLFKGGEQFGDSIVGANQRAIEAAIKNVIVTVEVDKKKKEEEDKKKEEEA
jgi:thioredoxin-like negative regulator of GroEL